MALVFAELLLPDCLPLQGLHLLLCVPQLWAAVPSLDPIAARLTRLAVAAVASPQFNMCVCVCLFVLCVGACPNFHPHLDPKHIDLSFRCTSRCLYTHCTRSLDYCTS